MEEMDTNGRNASIWKYQSLPIPRFEIVKTSAFLLGSSKFEPSKSEVQDLIREWSCWERLWVSPALVRRGGASCLLLLMPQKCREIPKDFSRWKFDFAGFPWHLLNTWWLSVRISHSLFPAWIPQSTINHLGFHDTKRILRFIHQNATFESNGSVKLPYLLNLHGKALNLQCQLQEADSTHLWDGRGHCTFQTFQEFPGCLGLAPASC